MQFTPVLSTHPPRDHQRTSRDPPWWLVLYSWPCLSKIISYSFLLCSTVIGLDLESHFHSREKMQSFEMRLRIIFLALAWRDEIEIIIRPFSYFETRRRLHIVILVFPDKIETLENHISWWSEKKWSLLLSRTPGIANYRWTWMPTRVDRHSRTCKQKIIQPISVPSWVYRNGCSGFFLSNTLACFVTDTYK